MKVHVARTRSPIANSCVPVVIELLQHQRRPHVHLAVADPADADVVLFPDCHLLAKDWRLHEIAASDAGRRYPHKIVVYDERDTPWCRFPGIYVSMPRRNFARRWQVAAGYYRVEDPATRLDGEADTIEPDLLASFVGGRTHPCRGALLRLDGPRIHVEATDGFVFYDPSSVRFAERRRSYAKMLFRSKFVLCPRGAGTSSIRLYETLAAGRVPVVISDEWVPPEGPPWDECTIRWSEDRIEELPGHLADLESRAEAMGRRARTVYEEWFAADVAFSIVLDQLDERRQAPGYPDLPAAGRHDGQFVRAATARGAMAYHAARARVAAHLPGR